jgi:hypothetical protein
VRQIPKRTTGTTRRYDSRKCFLGSLVLAAYSRISNTTQAEAKKTEHQIPIVLDDGENASINARSAARSPVFGLSVIQSRGFFLIAGCGARFETGKREGVSFVAALCIAL